MRWASISGWPASSAAEIDRLLAGESASGLPRRSPAPRPSSPSPAPATCGAWASTGSCAATPLQVESLRHVLAGGLADMAFTDPPYNVAYEGKTARQARPIRNDDLGRGFAAFLEAACRAMLSVTKGAVYICMASAEIGALQAGLRRSRRALVDLRDLVEERLHARPLGLPAPVRADPVRLGPRSTTGAAPATRATCGSIDRPAQERPAPDHEAGGLGRARDPELVEEAGYGARSVRRVGDDADGGGGMGRRAVLIELDPAYCDVIVRRWQEGTGKSATLEDTGQSFEEVAAERAQAVEQAA